MTSDSRTIPAAPDRFASQLPGHDALITDDCSFTAAGLRDEVHRGDYDLSSLRFAVTGAATVPVALVERMQSELDIDIVLTAYGLTEANGMGTMCRADDDAVTVATTCGRPFADNELRIDDSGEVLLRGPNIMLGYLDDPEATAAAIDADGWLQVRFVDALPRNAGGKVVKPQLRELA